MILVKLALIVIGCLFLILYPAINIYLIGEIFDIKIVNNWAFVLTVFISWLSSFLAVIMNAVNSLGDKK